MSAILIWEECATESGQEVYHGDRQISTHRLRVPGGWLYRVLLWEHVDHSGGPTSVTVIFVPLCFTDPEFPREDP